MEEFIAQLKMKPEGISEEQGISETARLIRKADQTKEVKISVIVPIYNSMVFLRECLDSIIQNSFEDYEIILIDDGSIDGSLEIEAEYAEKYSFITLLTQRNSGQGSARNLGVRLARGKYIQFVDSDDLIKDNLLGNAYVLMEKDTLDFAVFDGEDFAEADVSEKMVTKYDGYYLRDNQYDGVMSGSELFCLMNQNKEYRVQVGMMFFRRDFLLKNGIVFPYDILHEDELFCYEIYIKALRAEYIDRKSVV